MRHSDPNNIPSVEIYIFFEVTQLVYQAKIKVLLLHSMVSGWVLASIGCDNHR